MPIHDYPHEPDMEHGQAISGILFNIWWSYDWHTDTTSCYYVQDFKRSSLGTSNTDTWRLKPSTRCQLLVDRSELCTNVIFNFSQLILKASARKKSSWQHRLAILEAPGLQISRLRRWNPDRPKTSAIFRCSLGHLPYPFLLPAWLRMLKFRVRPSLVLSGPSSPFFLLARSAERFSSPKFSKPSHAWFIIMTIFTIRVHWTMHSYFLLFSDSVRLQCWT